MSSMQRQFQNGNQQQPGVTVFYIQNNYTINLNVQDFVPAENNTENNTEKQEDNIIINAVAHAIVFVFGSFL
jgi:hypothetical protein